MTEQVVIHNPPNTGESMDRIWAFVSRDEAGKENVCGYLTALGPTPLMTGNPDLLEGFKTLARELAKVETGKSIHMLCFTNREELEGWR